MLLLVSFMVLLRGNAVNLEIVSGSARPKLGWSIHWHWVAMLMVRILIFNMVVGHELLLWVMHVNLREIDSSIVFKNIWRWLSKVCWHSFADAGYVFPNQGAWRRFTDPVTTWLVRWEIVLVSKSSYRVAIFTAISCVVGLRIAILVIGDSMGKNIFVFVVRATRGVEGLQPHRKTIVFTIVVRAHVLREMVLMVSNRSIWI